MILINHITSRLTIVLLILSVVLCLPTKAQDQYDNIWSEMDNSNNETSKQLDIGQALWQAGHTLKAEEIFFNAYEQATNKKDKLEAANKLADFYITETWNDKAVYTYSHMLEDEDLAHDTVTLIYIHEGLGRAYKASAQYVKSIKSYREAERLLSEHPDSSLSSMLYTSMCHTLVEAGDVREASALIDSAKRLANKGDILKMANILQTEANIYAKLGDYRKAYFGLDSATNLNKMIWSREVNTIMNTTNPILQQQREEARRESMDLALQLKDSKNSQNLGIWIIIVLGFVLGVSLVTIIIRQVKLRHLEDNIKHLDTANRDKDRVISIVAHDATNQFNILLGFADMLMERAKEWSEIDAEMVGQIYSSAQCLYQSNNNLLLWSKGTDQLKPNRSIINLIDRIKYAINVANIMAQQKEIMIFNEIKEEMMAYVDPNHIDIILRNILTYAIKFTERGGHITITGVIHGNRTSIIIEDTGVGMNEESVHSFNTNSRVTSTDGTSNEKGTGLGLSICRELAKINEGDISLESEIKKGTSITITLKNSLPQSKNDETTK